MTIGARPLKNGHLAVRHLSLLVCCALILHGSPNKAKADHYRFQTSQRNIFCQIDQRGLSCDLVDIRHQNGESRCKQKDCDELRFFLPQSGKAFALPRSDSMAFFTANTISAGKRLTAGSIKCFISSDALSCTNLSGGTLLLKHFGYALNVKSHSLIPTSNDSN